MVEAFIADKPMRQWLMGAGFGGSARDTRRWRLLSDGIDGPRFLSGLLGLGSALAED